MVLPDTDVLVYYAKKNFDGDVEERYHLATISCKVSFHARHTESLFWAIAMKNHGAKFVMASEDKIDELGTCKDGNKTRRLLESYMDGVYLLKRYQVKSNSILGDVSRFFKVFQRAEAQTYHRQGSHVFASQPKDRFCDRVRPFDDLLFDLMQWKFQYLNK